jgi:hypothetical protein
MILDDLPSAKQLDCRTIWAAIFAGARYSRRQSLAAPTQDLLDERPRDSAEGNYHPAGPWSILLPRIRSNIDVHEPLRWRTLNEWTLEIRQPVLSILGHR